MNDWIKLDGNMKLFDEAAKDNCLCKFDNGYICNYFDDWPYAIITHFQLTLKMTV